MPAATLDLSLLASSTAEQTAVAFLQDAARAGKGELTTAAVLEQARGSPHQALFDELVTEILDWDEAYDVNAELAGLVEKLKRGKENAAFREIISSGGIDELSSEQRERLRDYRRGGAAALDTHDP